MLYEGLKENAWWYDVRDLQCGTRVQAECGARLFMSNYVQLLGGGTSAFHCAMA